MWHTTRRLAFTAVAVTLEFKLSNLSVYEYLNQKSQRPKRKLTRRVACRTLGLKSCASTSGGLTGL